MDDDYVSIDNQATDWCINEPDLRRKAVDLILKNMDKFTKDDLELLKSYISSIHMRRWITTPIPVEYRKSIDSMYFYGLRLNCIYQLFNILRNLKAGKNITGIGVSIMSLISSIL